jgi:hypothetical protein
MPSDAPDLPDVFVLFNPYLPLYHPSEVSASPDDPKFARCGSPHHYIPASRVASMQAELDSLRAVVGQVAFVGRAITAEDRECDDIDWEAVFAAESAMQKGGE